MPAVDPVGSFWSAQEDHIQTLWRLQGVRLLEIYAKGYGLIMGGPSIPAPPPPPDPNAVAQANAAAYRMNVDTYIQKAPEMAALENKLRTQYMPQQRSLERQLSALDQQSAALAGLQLERQFGPQRTLEGLRRSYEYSPQAYALNRGLGQQMTRQFQQLYGTSPYAAVEPGVAFAPRNMPPVDIYGTIGTNVSNPRLAS
jgi:hypothetical protein